MATITLENVPVSLERRLGKRVDFSKITGLHFDGMDWCQYGEVIPTQEDIKAYNDSMKSTETISYDDFKKSLK